MIRLTLPLPYAVYRGKRALLTMNVYRNLHYKASNIAKKAYSQLAWIELRAHKHTRLKSAKIRYTLYTENSRRIDLSNVLAVVDKFFSDSLVAVGIIEDDSQKFVKRVEFVYGGVGPERVEIDIEEAA